MPPPKGKPIGHRNQRSYSSSRSRSLSPYQKKSKYLKSRSRSPRSARRKSPPSKFHQSQHRNYAASARKRIPSGKPYNLKKRSRTPSPYGRGSPPPHKSTARPKTSHTQLQRRDKLDNSRPLEAGGNRGRSPIYTGSKQHRLSESSGNRDRSPIYTGSKHDRFDLKTRRSWSPEQSFQYSDRDGKGRSGAQRRRSPSPEYNMGQGPSAMLFPAAAKFTSITGPISIPQSHTTGIKMTLNNRFQFFDDLELPLIVEDNITIGIHRRGPNMVHDSHQQIIRSFRQGDTLDVHRKDEGKYPIFDREEIKVFRHDDILDDEVYEEKRTISVAHSKPKGRRDSYETDRRIIQGKAGHSSRYIEPQIKFDPRPDPRYESLLTDARFKDEAKVTRIQRNPNDLRHSLQKRRHDDDDEDDDEDDQHFDARKKIEAKRKHSHRDDRVQSKERYSDKMGDRRQDRSRSSDSRQKQATETEVLPDFSNRPGRLDADLFKQEEWKDKPEMIPKNPMYYEHDTREDDQGYVGRGRYSRRPYRQGFRTRGSYTYNRGSSSSSSSTTTQQRTSSYKGTNFIPNFRPRGFRRPYNSNYRGRGSNTSSDYYRKTSPSSDRKGWTPHWKQNSNTSGDRVWKHDLYDDKEKSEGDTGGRNNDEKKTNKEESREDNKPTSTT
ncbi:uncharacterized protein LOC110443490 isoform X2 [Mizuhopecten yessoensis]|uniref:Btz domain-containing protein n=1 Tax=Mizuhopecten yessoensis TaxID=6573 RepID=A0A210PEV7_MIZYE|nr:uncharacterized protein LOC110443490 isoform X2 [Mizuhopecten yessoensis]OWF34986.1 hypothetical protein KP79_PYT23808 [Mizuhopecten yessoensis]